MNTIAPAPARSRVKRVVLILLGVVALLIAVPLIAFAIWRSTLSGKVEARLKEIRQQGYPINSTQLDEWYASVTDDEDNAALVIEEAARTIFKEKSKAKTELENKLRALGRKAPLSPALEAHVTETVTMNEEALKLLHQAARCPESRYPVDLSRGPSTLLPHLKDMRECAHLLRKEMLLAMRSNQLDRAASAARDSFAIGQSLRHEPLLISFLVRIAAHGVACGTLERALNHVALTEAQLQQISAAVEGCDDSAAFHRALAGERAGAIPVFRMSPREMQHLLKDELGNRFPARTAGSFNRVTGFFDRDLLFYLTVMQTNLDAIGQPAAQRLARTAQMGQAAAAAKQKFYILSALLLPALEKCFQKDAENSARLRTAATALAIERYRLAHGNALPESLDALIPQWLKQVPKDPFDDEPLRYRKTRGGYVVYSLGADLADDGGSEAPPQKDGRSSKSPMDITFTVER